MNRAGWIVTQSIVQFTRGLEDFNSLWSHRSQPTWGCGFESGLKSMQLEAHVNRAYITLGPIISVFL